VNITRKFKYKEAEHTGSAAGGTLGRRGVLGGLAAIPVLYSIGGVATQASAATAPAAPAARPVGAQTAANDLVRGQERRYHAPLLTAGTRLVLPAGVKAASVQDYYGRPRLASGSSAWPYLTAADGTRVDASVVPEPGAPTRVAILSGFSEGWYELIHANGRADRVTWDAAELPFLWLYGEFGATNQAPYDRFFTLALQPLSRSPFSTPNR
jgi:hypothetical protein